MFAPHRLQAVAAVALLALVSSLALGALHLGHDHHNEPFAPDDCPLCFVMAQTAMIAPIAPPLDMGAATGEVISAVSQISRQRIDLFLLGPRAPPAKAPA